MDRKFGEEDSQTVTEGERCQASGEKEEVGDGPLCCWGHLAETLSHHGGASAGGQEHRRQRPEPLPRCTVKGQGGRESDQTAYRALAQTEASATGSRKDPSPKGGFSGRTGLAGRRKSVLRQPNTKCPPKKNPASSSRAQACGEIRSQASDTRVCVS